ncbi:MAG: hypothetical protein A2Y77_13920 [Planctomycetes bacterium RBG_13_62_9]|nr:MAG: hypothetical protein A2Y77_13920 [Planctomycetes bacterium RBG_13_62_9]
MSYTRRDFLGAALGLSALPISNLKWSAGAVARTPDPRSASRPSERDTVLVVIQLTGGNDGLNTVVPYADDAYARNRTTLRLPTGELHKIDSLLAFHPRMEAFQRLYKEDCLSIVQGVGHPNPDQSHERAMRIWHTGDLISASPAGPQRPARQTGWLGRVVDRAWSPTKADVTAVFVGPISRPFALNAENVFVPCIRSASGNSGSQISDFGLSPRVESATRSSPSAGDPLLQFVRQRTLDASAKCARIEAVIKAGSGSTDYPSFGLAGDLRTIAQLIRADIGIRIFFAELGGGGIGGFDNHANQLGNQCALLHQLSESVAAFMYDLKRDNLLDRVLLMTFSEFGRSVKENGRRGTDHGAAAPMFLAGGRVRSGLIGPHPSLTDLDKGALKFGLDFRQVYATVLDQWLGFDSQVALGRRFEPLDVLKT